MKSTSCLKIFVVRSVLCCTMLCASLLASAQLPVAKFSGTTVSGCAPILVHFTDESTGNPNYWKWDLGNGTISYLQQPSVTYFNPGIYSVKLVVKNAAGEDSVTRTDYVQVYAAPVVNFSASQTSGCNSVFTNFNNQSSSSNGWQWDFGDGIFSTEQNPLHLYTQTGNYNVSLKVMNSDGCAATLLKQAYIQVNTVKAAFSNTAPVRCEPLKISFQDHSTGNGRLQYKWFLGNGDSSVAAQPSLNYVTGGSYTVKLIVQNEFGCSDTATKNINVENAVSAAFSANITKACKAPAHIGFSNQQLSGNNYYWDFGDTTATGSNPVHVFRDTGSYSVKLIIRNSNGCTDSLTKTGYISIQKPFVSLENLPDSGCAPFTKKLTALTEGTDTVTQYWWIFGDGQTSQAIAPTHTFTNQGYFTVSLVTTGISGCKDTVTIENAIRTGSKPRPAFTADTRVACGQTPINFTDLSTGGATQWQWDFGDQSQAVDQHPMHRFTDTGFLSVQLIAYNGGCADTLRVNKYVYIKPAIAKFKYDFTCAAPFTFLFSNFSIGADTWQWDFGDGTTSTVYNPVHTYQDTGMYSVALTVSNSTTGCSALQTKMVKAVKIHPGFFASDTMACKGKEIIFTATLPSSGVSRFIWSFGDGTITNTRENNVTHIYELPGIYTVKLITINLVNCRDTVIKTNYIVVNGLKAKFANAVNAACINSSVLFNDSSYTEGNNTIQSWQWNFGDGTIQRFTAPPFTHTYSSRGNFHVALMVTDNAGCSDSYVMDMPLSIKKINPVFWTPDTIKCSNSPVVFVSPYAEQGVRYRWDFGDGTSSSIQSPAHLYTAAGNYSVKLNITDSAGCQDSSIHNNYIKVEDPAAIFSMSDSFRSCPPLIVQFTDQSLNAVETSWDFGDGSTTSTHNPSHFYSYPGTYTVSLTIKGRGGCSSKMQKQVVVKGPKGSLSYTPLNFCKPGDAIFTAHTADAVSYIWDFNDGTTVLNSDSTITHHYDSTGNYVPKLLLSDNNGCKVPINGADTIHVVQLLARFEFANTTLCSADNINFVNTSVASENIIRNTWDFGDGYFADNVAAPSHDYQLPGLYHPSLIITTANGCIDSFKTTVPVKVVAAPGAIIQSTPSACLPLNASFAAIANSNSAPVVQWQWDFGNGNKSSQQTAPAQLYRTAGNFTITLRLTSNEGCEKVITKTIEAYPLPVIQFSGDTEICKGSAATVTASGANSYNWLPSATLSCTTCASTIVTPITNSMYTVTGVNSFGCSAKDSVMVTVIQPFSISYRSTASLCAGKSVSLPVTGADVYNWSPSAGLDDIHAAAPTAQPSATTVYRVTGTDSKGCFTDTGYVTVAVNELPWVEAGADKNTSAGVPIELVPLTSADVTDVKWSPTESVFRNTGNGITVKPMVTTEYTVAVKNAAGCAASDKVTVAVTPGNSAGTLFVPNTFSPNGDGVNDVFYPRAAVNIKINKLKIMNREGVIVFERNNFYSNDAGSGWNGTWRGTKLPADIYVYAAEVAGDNGKPYLISGNLSMLR